MMMVMRIRVEGCFMTTFACKFWTR